MTIHPMMLYQGYPRQVTNLKLNELSPIVFEHYQGPKNPLPPNICKLGGQQLPHNWHNLAESVSSALKSYVEWLCTIVNTDEPGTEWARHVIQLARENGSLSKATKFIFGPLIDATLNDPDTVLTAMTYIETFIKMHGKKYAHLIVDVQLYKLVIKIKWSDPNR